MKLPDVNIWLALALSGHSHHAAARDWLETEEEPGSIFFCRSTQQGLVRLLTTAEVLGAYGLPPLTNWAAWEVVEKFMGDDRMAFANEPAGIEHVWKRLALRDTSSPKLWMDAWIGAFAVCSDFKLVTTDKAFTQFDDVQVIILQRTSP